MRNEVHRDYALIQLDAKDIIEAASRHYPNLQVPVDAKVRFLGVLVDYEHPVTVRWHREAPKPKYYSEGLVVFHGCSGDPMSTLVCTAPSEGTAYAIANAMNRDIVR